MTEAACAGNSCLFDIIVGGRRGKPPPPMTPEGQASEQELWLEAEVARMQRESLRLRSLNMTLRSELLFLEASPKRTTTDMTMFFDSLPPTKSDGGSEEEEEETEEPAEAYGRRVKFDIIRTTSGDPGADEVDLDGLAQESPPGLPEGRSISDASLARRIFSTKSTMISGMSEHVNSMVTKGSALSMTRPAQALIYTLALGFAIFVLLATATHLGAHGDHHDDHGSEDAGADAHGDHVRRLGGAVSPLMKNIAVTLAASGLLAMLVNLLRLPLILAYLFSGMLVGPLGLKIVESHLAMAEMSNLGLIFLLFMIGLELDVKTVLKKMGTGACMTGFLQLPICSAVMAILFLGLESTGVNFGSGKYGALYCGAVGGLSSTMLVVKCLETHAMADSIHGRLTVGILICQNLWVIVILALQINLSSPTFASVFHTFGALIALVAFALFYAKFVMPAALYCASKSVELMLVLALAWCFFICVTAILPFVALPMELSALVAGIALATFPYSSEFNGKIKYIRDFFFTLFFAGMGMMLPWPTWGNFGASIAMCVILCLVRWVGVFAPLVVFGLAPRYAAMTTINLSQVGEVALVITSLGVAHKHIDTETLEVVIMAFTFMSIVTPKMIKESFWLYKMGAKLIAKWREGSPGEDMKFSDAAAAGKDDDDREIMLLGFHKVAYMLAAEFMAKTPELLKTIHVIDYNKKVCEKLRAAGIKCTTGDITDHELLENSQRNPPRIVISTIPDSVLQGTTNEQLVRIAKGVFPTSRVIVTAGDPHQAKLLYKAGADYVVRMAKLSAEKLHDILCEHGQSRIERSKLKELFEQHKMRDNMRGSSRILGMGFFK